MISPVCVKVCNSASFNLPVLTAGDVTDVLTVTALESVVTGCVMKITHDSTCTNLPKRTAGDVTGVLTVMGLERVTGCAMKITHSYNVHDSVYKLTQTHCK